jgi:serine/threonine protein kinase
MVSQSGHSPNIGLPLGSLLQGRFRPTRELGRGLASIVYLGHDHHHREDEVALKVLAVNADQRVRVRHEVMTAWEIRHDHIVAVRGCFEDGERCCVVMDYVAGPDLGALVATAPISPDEAAAVGRGIALGLQAAHRRGILHRHVKPSNILIAPEVRGRLADFGSAGFGGTHEETTSKDYLAPEVLAGQAADGRADIYGLGLSLYFALTGQLPDRQAAADGHRASRVRQTVPHWLDDAIAQATAALPADRFNSAGRFAAALAPAPNHGDGGAARGRAATQAQRR